MSTLLGRYMGIGEKSRIGLLKTIYSNKNGVRCFAQKRRTGPVTSGSTNPNRYDFAQVNHLESPGMRTTANILNLDSHMGLLVSGFSNMGFRLNNNVKVVGGMILLPTSALAWNALTSEHITADRLLLFTLLVPKPDIVVVGVGLPGEQFEVGKRLLPLIVQYKLTMEILPTAHAVPTYNYLRSERRNVMGAFVPPKVVDAGRDDFMTTGMNYYGTEWTTTYSSEEERSDGDFDHRYKDR